MADNAATGNATPLRFGVVAPIQDRSTRVARPGAPYRLSRAGDRQLNYALHVMAMAQIKRATPGRDYYQRKRAAGKPTSKPCAA